MPDDVSVTGFDDLPLATALEPELTTVRLPAEAVGEAGLRALVSVLEGVAVPPASLPVELVPRASSGAVVSSPPPRPFP